MLRFQPENGQIPILSIVESTAIRYYNRVAGTTAPLDDLIGFFSNIMEGNGTDVRDFIPRTESGELVFAHKMGSTIATEARVRFPKSPKNKKT